MEKGSNQSGVFIRCSVRDYGGKNYNMMFPEGNGIVGGWRILAEKMRQLGVRSSDEIQREEKAEKTQREEKQRTSKLLPRLLKPILNPLAEVSKSEKILGGKVAYVKVGEEEVQERLDQLRRCLVGWWGSGPAQIPGVEAVRRWARMQWNIKNSLAVVNLGRGLWLFEFESKEQVDRVLKFGKRRFGTNLVHLRTWGEDMGCSSQSFSEEKAWVRVVGLPVHLWSRTVMEKIGDACGEFLAVDEETDELDELGLARILVRLKKPEPPNTVEVAYGGTRFRMQLWWELSPQYTTVLSSDQKRNPSFYRDDEGVSRAWERVEGALSRLQEETWVTSTQSHQVRFNDSPRVSGLRASRWVKFQVEGRVRIRVRRRAKEMGGLSSPTFFRAGQQEKASCIMVVWALIWAVKLAQVLRPYFKKRRRPQLI